MSEKGTSKTKSLCEDSNTEYLNVTVSHISKKILPWKTYYLGDRVKDIGRN